MSQHRGSSFLALGTISAAIALTAGCGSSSPKASAEGKKSAQDVLADSKSALFNAKAVHVKGSDTQAGETEQLDIQFQGQDSDGSITIAGSTVKIIKTGGNVYLNAPAAFWTKAAGTKASVLANKWIKATDSETGSLGDLSLQGIAAGINAEDSPLKPEVTKGDSDGTKALILSQQDGSMLYVKDDSSPLPLKITQAGKSTGTITFSDYGKTKTISVPAGAVTAQQAATSAQTPT